LTNGPHFHARPETRPSRPEPNAGPWRVAISILGASLLALLPAAGTAGVVPKGTGTALPVEGHRTAWSHLPAEDFILYMPQKYDSCLGCHPKEMAEEEDFNVDTNWRDTTLGKNLHSLHVYRQPTGVNCSVCHVLDKDDAVNYGDRVNLKMTEKGGACTPACHRPKSYHNAGRFRFLPGKQP
jgi:hypothetical protein